jgi:hypothetical protein
MKYFLSKSKYIRGLQCSRALWLDVYHPELAQYSRETMRKFDRGREFERLFKDQFPDAVDVSAALRNRFNDYPAFTEEVLQRDGEVDLFEAGFLFDNVLVLADVVHKNADGRLDIYEVKSGSTLSETYKNDAAVQHYVISHCHNINSFSIVYNGNSDHPDQSDRSDQSDQSPNFKIVNLTEELALQHALISNNISCMKEVLKGGEPDITPGDRCTTPYECPYKKYCDKGLRHLSLF